jgi:molecular chaperone GrpE
MSPDKHETDSTPPTNSSSPDDTHGRDSAGTATDDARSDSALPPVARTGSAGVGEPAPSAAAPDDISQGDLPVADKLNVLREALRAAEAEVLRGQAELENFRKRARRDMEEERRYASLPLMRDLLPVMDNLQRALAHGAQVNADSEPLLAGVQMVVQELSQTLEKHHCHRIEAAGAPFDPNYHEAIGQQASSEHAAGQVALVVTEGYRLHDRVIRPSQVLVSTGSPESTSDTTTSKE